jgi:hypothetical protein
MNTKDKIRYSNYKFKKGKLFCRACLSPINLETHHIRPVEYYPKKALDKSNLIVLCKNCHRTGKYSIHRLMGNDYSPIMFYIWLYLRFAFVNLIRLILVFVFILVWKGLK